MSALKLSVAPESPEVLVGASLFVRVTLANGGQTAAEVPDTLSPSEFEFTLKPVDGGVARKLSARLARFTRNPDPRPATPRRVKSLAPGAQIEYVENLTNYAVPPLQPGRYRLTVTMAGGGRLQSAPVPLAIVAPRVSSLAVVTADNTETFALTFAHAAAGGAVDFYQQENRANRPDDGVAYRRFGSAPPLAVGGVAVAVDLAQSRRGRWFGWVQGEAVGGGVGQDQATFARHEPVPLGLKSATLQSVGWQPAIETGRFAVVGTDAQKRVAFALATFQVRGGGAVKAVPLAAEGLPVKWAARYRPGDAERYDVVTATVGGQKTRVTRQTVAPEKGTAEPPVVLVERDAPPAALALAPVAADSPGVVDVLFGPAGENGQMTLLRLPLEGGAPQGEWKFVAPMEENKQRPTEWAIPATPLDNPLVLAKLGNKLLMRRAAGGGWRTLAEGAAEAAHLRLEVVGDQTWAVWADAASGLNYKLIELP
jgi:hypothetical protein